MLGIFVDSISFNPHDNLERIKLLSSPFYRTRHLGTERLSYMLRATQRCAAARGSAAREEGVRTPSPPTLSTRTQAQLADSDEKTSAPWEGPQLPGNGHVLPPPPKVQAQEQQNKSKTAEGWTCSGARKTPQGLCTVSPHRTSSLLKGEGGAWEEGV